MKKILIIENDEFIRNYLKERLEEFGFEIIIGRDGFEGSLKIKNETPDLIITEYNLTRITFLEMLKEKNNLKSTVDIPLILISSNIDRDLLTKVSRYKIFRFLSKPVKIDILVQILNELFNLSLKIDTTPSIMDVHMNDDILFLEFATGLNKEKLMLLKYKIISIKELHKEPIIKILIILSNITQMENLNSKIITLIDTILANTNASLQSIKILTSSSKIKEILSTDAKYRSVKVTSNFVETIESFGKIDQFNYGDEVETIKQNIISTPKSYAYSDPAMLKYDSESYKSFLKIGRFDKKFTVAIVDDDLSTLEYIATILASEGLEVNTYENGKVFMMDMSDNKPDVVFLDLMMPEMDGFQVLETMKRAGIIVPIIITTALSQKEVVVKASKLGVNSFLMKPLKSEAILKKIEEVLLLV